MLRWFRLGIVAVGSLVPLLFVTAAFGEIALLFDPCHAWGQTDGALAPDDGCTTRSASSETRLGMVLRLVLVQGTTLVAVGLAVTGAALSWRWLVGVAAALLLLLSVPLFLGMAWVFTLTGAIFYAVAALLPDAKRMPFPLPPAP